MKLLVVTNDFPPTIGGIENYTYSLVRRWPKAEVIVLTRLMRGSKSFDRSLDFRVVREPVGTLLPTPALVEKVERIIVEDSVDVVHFPSCLPLGMMGPRLNIPFAVSVHGGEFVLASRLPVARSLLKAVCRSAFVLLPESSFAAMLIRRLVGPQVAVRLVPGGVDPERYGPEAAPPIEVSSPGPVIVFVGRLVIRKGPRTLLAAMPAMRHDQPNVHLLLVGTGPDLPYLRRFATQAGLTSSVSFCGPQPWIDVPRYYSAGDVFALPTRERFGGTETEGLPLVLLEAAATGLPLVGGRAGGVADVVREGQTGFLVNGASPEDTAGAILKVLNDPALGKRMGEAARQMVLEEFSWDALAVKYQKALALAP